MFNPRAAITSEVETVVPLSVTLEFPITPVAPLVYLGIVFVVPVPVLTVPDGMFGATMLFVKVPLAAKIFPYLKEADPKLNTASADGMRLFWMGDVITTAPWGVGFITGQNFGFDKSYVVPVIHC